MRQAAETEGNPSSALVHRQCLPTRAKFKNHVWSYDFAIEQAVDGRWVVMLPIVDEYTHECLALEVGLSMRPPQVLSTFERLFQERTPPGYIRSDTAPEAMRQAVEAWLVTSGHETLALMKGDPWEDSWGESFKRELRDGLSNLDLFADLEHARILVEQYRKEYNYISPQRDLRYLSPAKFAGNFDPDEASTVRSEDTSTHGNARRFAAVVSYAASCEQWRRRIVGGILAACLIVLCMIHFPALRASIHDRLAPTPAPFTARRLTWTSDYPPDVRIDGNAQTESPPAVNGD